MSVILFAFGSAAFAKPPRILSTSPKGTYRVELLQFDDTAAGGNEGEAGECVVKVSDPGQRTPIPQTEGESPYDYFFSPDEKWFAVNIHYGSKMAGFRLYEMKQGTKLERVLDEHPAWKWLEPGKLEALSVADMMRQGGFSSDSSRLLLRTPIGGEAIARGKPTANFFLYYNLRSHKFELTDYLRNVNRNAMRILRSKDPEQPIYEAQPEPTDRLPSEDAVRARFEAADQKLNKVYALLMEKLKGRPDELSSLRARQREWIKTRDLGAGPFAAVRPASERAAYRQYYLAEATESRVRELEDYMGRVSE